MAEVSPTLKEIRAINDSFPYITPIKAWKEQGKKVVAFQCTYVPEEVLHAAGVLPVRLFGDPHQTALDEAGAYMYTNTCSFIRNCLELVLRKRYDFLDGFVAAATCDCSRRLFDVWDYYEFTPFHHILSVPRKISDGAYQLCETEIKELIARLEEWLDVRVTSDALNRSIRVYNRRRHLLRTLHELKKSDIPPITGSETLEVLNASSFTPPERFNEILERLLGELNGRKPGSKARFRLMINGSPLNNPEFIQTIEDLGGRVVIDELCTGIRYWWEGIDPDPDPVKAICRRYLHNFPCPRMEPSEDRLQRVLKLVKDYRVDGVINQVVRYCVPQLMEQPLLREALEEIGVPVLELDIEYGMPGTGQIMTRIQAFLEMLERGRRR